MTTEGRTPRAIVVDVFSLRLPYIPFLTRFTPYPGYSPIPNPPFPPPSHLSPSISSPIPSHPLSPTPVEGCSHPSKTDVVSSAGLGGDGRLGYWGFAAKGGVVGKGGGIRRCALYGRRVGDVKQRRAFFFSSVQRF